MAKISVIIPLYNAEKYLKQCLDSIVNQTLKDIEIICVDDCSTDNSVKICQEYAIQDDRIIVIQQESNQGAGAARNKGISIAKGEFLHFMDADDYLVNNAYKNVFDSLPPEVIPNIIRFKAQAFNDKTKKNIENPTYEFKKIEKKYLNKVITVDNNWDQVKGIAVVPWGGFIKREFVIENKLQFNNLKVCNDRSFFISSIIKANEIYLADVYVVMYRENNCSSLRGIRHKYMDCDIKSIYIIKDYCYKNNISKELYKKIMLRELSNLYLFYVNYATKKQISFDMYKKYIQFSLKFNLADIEPEIKSEWYYPIIKLHIKVNYETALLNYMLRYIIDIYSNKQKHLIIILFQFIKFKIKMK